MYNWVMLISAFALVGLNALFVAAEFAFVKVMRVRIEVKAETGDWRAKSALFGIIHLDAYLSVCQLGITLASLGLGWIGKPAVSSLLMPLFSILGIVNPVLIDSISLVAGFSFITFMHVIFGELMPKTVSIQRSEGVALALAPIMQFFYIVFFPLVKILNGTSNLFLRLFGVRQGDGEHSHTSEELQMLIVDSQRSGLIDEQESRMLDNVIRLDSRDVSDVMVHRMDTSTLSVDESIQSALQEIKKTGHTRFPVYKKDRDNIVGFINLKDLVGADTTVTIKSFVRKPFYVIESMSLDDLLLKMQKKRLQLGIVIDEYGGWQGIVTMEDILEVIVGDLKDEHDIRDPSHIQENSQGIIQIQAGTSVEELYEYLSLPAEDQDDYKTVAGLFLDKFGMVPEKEDSVIFSGYRFIVNKVDGKRIKEIEAIKVYD